MTATDDYFRNRAASFGGSAVILDLGCGDGRFVEMLLDDGIDVLGVDVLEARPSMVARADKRPALNLMSRIIFFNDPERIPLPDNSVDVVVSNTVFEHILFLSSTIRELARILRPGGRVYTVFPLGSAIIEQHCGLPCIHAMESRKLRLAYIKAAKLFGLYRNPASPDSMEEYIYSSVFYRRENEIRQLFGANFDKVESDIHTYINVKANSLLLQGGLRGLMGRFLKTNVDRLATWVHLRHSAAYCLSSPRKSS
jgi:SAM-dependent methyltransferase